MCIFDEEAAKLKVKSLVREIEVETFSPDYI